MAVFYLILNLKTFIKKFENLMPELSWIAESKQINKTKSNCQIKLTNFNKLFEVCFNLITMKAAINNCF